MNTVWSIQPAYVTPMHPLILGVLLAVLALILYARVAIPKQMQRLRAAHEQRMRLERKILAVVGAMHTALTNRMRGVHGNAELTSEAEAKVRATFETLCTAVTALLAESPDLSISFTDTAADTTFSVAITARFPAFDLPPPVPEAPQTEDALA